MDELCQKCKNLGYCKYRVTEKLIAEALDMTPDEKREAINELYINAIDRDCPNIFFINTDYPGKERI